MRDRQVCVVTRMKLLIAALLLSGCPATATAPEALASDGKEYTLRLEGVKDGFCSGTAVGRRTVLTAGHCIKDDDKAILVNGTLVGILNIERDGADHALIEVTITFPKAAKVVGAPKQGARVHWYGQPMGLADIYGEGVVVGHHQGKILLDANFWFGVSGSALLNEHGDVVGVVSGILGQQIYKLGFAYPFAFTDEQWAAIK